MCRDELAGRTFREQHRLEHQEMFVRGNECAQGLGWNHRGAAPWAAQFSELIRARVESAAIDAMATAPMLGPGAVVKIVLARLGYKPHPNCGCDEFGGQMNGWGWWGCIRRRDEIIRWFASKAREQGIDVDQQTIWSLLRGALRDLASRRRKARE